MTLPEVALWHVLRERPGGFKFRRQHPVGPYVLDFYCAAASLAVEVDGMAHDMGDHPARDERRDLWLAGQGIFVLRVPATEVLRDLDAVVTAIHQRCALPLHQPSAGPPPRASHRED
jgi:very-short-patch-repair endonuclease